VKRSLVALIVVAVALVALPLAVKNEFYVNLASQILIYALLAMSLNLLLGYGGMVSLGHASFLGAAELHDSEQALYPRPVALGLFDAPFRLP